MNTITIKGRKCVVDFSLVSSVDAKYNRRFLTTCIIIDDSHRPFSGLAIKAPGDLHYKTVGQKVALKRAFEQMYQSTPSLQNEEFSLAYEKVRVGLLGAEPE